MRAAQPSAALRILLCVLLAGTSSALHVRGLRALPRHRRALPPSCCICINCKWVDRCQTYHWVETQHEQPHVTAAPTFDPNDPQIQVFIRKEGDADADVMDGADDGSTDGMRSQILTTEYDVFACDAFEEEKGKWLRLMPDADFIPT